MHNFLHDARDPNYWALRKGMEYYGRVAEVVESLGCHGSILDVGCCTTDIVLCGAFARRVSIDILPRPELPGVEAIEADYLTHHFTTPFDVVTCCQVLEHVPDPAAMLGKLFRDGRWVVVTVPYLWPHRPGHPHVHDPIDREKLAAWAGRPPVMQEEITETGRKLGRLLALYRGNAGGDADGG